MRIVRRLAVLLLAVAPISLALGVSGASGVSNSTTTAFTPAPTTPEVYGAETIASTAFMTTVVGAGPASDFPEGTVDIVATGPSPATTATTVCSSDFASANTTVTAPSTSNYTCTGAGSDTLLGAGTYAVTADFIPGTPSASLVGFTYTASTSAPDAYVVEATTTTSATTLAAGPYAAGGTASDTDTITGAVNASGDTVVFTYYYGNATCTAPSAGAVDGTVSGDTATVSIPLPDTEGTTFSVSAVYNGDTNNTGSTAACEAGAATVAATPVVSTSASAAGTTGSSISDTVTITGLSGTNATGLVTVYAQLGSCTGTIYGSQSVPIGPTITGTTSTFTVAFPPTDAGTYYWTASYAGDVNNSPATEACNTSTTTEVTVVSSPTVTPPPPAAPTLTITTHFLPNALRGQHYSATLTVTGGVTPYTWTIAAGHLPPGLTLSSSGVISGLVGAVGTYTFTVDVTDSSVTPGFASRQFSITVVA